MPAKWTIYREFGPLCRAGAVRRRRGMRLGFDGLHAPAKEIYYVTAFVPDADAPAHRGVRQAGISKRFTKKPMSTRHWPTRASSCLNEALIRAKDNLTLATRPRGADESSRRARPDRTLSRSRPSANYAGQLS